MVTLETESTPSSSETETQASSDRFEPVYREHSDLTEKKQKAKAVATHDGQATNGSTFAA